MYFHGKCPVAGENLNLCKIIIVDFFVDSGSISSFNAQVQCRNTVIVGCLCKIGLVWSRGTVTGGGGLGLFQGPGEVKGAWNNIIYIVAVVVVVIICIKVLFCNA